MCTSDEKVNKASSLKGDVFTLLHDFIDFCPCLVGFINFWPVAGGRAWWKKVAHVMAARKQRVRVREEGAGNKIQDPKSCCQNPAPSSRPFLIMLSNYESTYEIPVDETSTLMIRSPSESPI